MQTSEDLRRIACPWIILLFILDRPTTDMRKQVTPRPHLTVLTIMGEISHCPFRMMATSFMPQRHQVRRLAAPEAARKAATSEWCRAGRNLAAGITAAMADSFLPLAICFDTNARNQDKQRKQHVQIAEQNSPELRQEMDIYYTTSASNEKALKKFQKNNKAAVERGLK